MLHNTRVSIYVYITSVFLNKYSIFMHTEGVNYLIAFKKNTFKNKTMDVAVFFFKLCCTLKRIL